MWTIFTYGIVASTSLVHLIRLDESETFLYTIQLNYSLIIEY